MAEGKHYLSKKMDSTQLRLAKADFNFELPCGSICLDGS